MENDKPRCQSCGMPLGEHEGQDNFGREANDTKNEDYCMYCYQKGGFTEPHLTVEGMINKSVNHMVKELNSPENKARELANSFIPKLKRWVN